MNLQKPIKAKLTLLMLTIILILATTIPLSAAPPTIPPGPSPLDDGVYLCKDGQIIFDDICEATRDELLMQYLQNSPYVHFVDDNDTQPQSPTHTMPIPDPNFPFAGDGRDHEYEPTVSVKDPNVLPIPTPSPDSEYTQLEAATDSEGAYSIFLHILSVAIALPFRLPVTRLMHLM